MPRKVSEREYTGLFILLSTIVTFVFLAKKALGLRVLTKKSASRKMEKINNNNNNNNNTPYFLSNIFGVFKCRKVKGLKIVVSLGGWDVHKKFRFGNLNGRGCL
jgi:hypothetical protein